MRFRTTWAAGILSTALWLTNVNCTYGSTDGAVKAHADRRDDIDCPMEATRGNQRNAAAREVDGHYKSAGADLAFRRFGNGPIVVVLSGGPGIDADYLVPVAKGIAGLGYQSILPDLRGTGRSVKAGSDSSMLTVKGSVADIEALRCALGEDRLRLVGHSFGGAIELAYAAEHPKHVSHLVALDSVGPDMGAEALYDDAVKHNLTSDEIAEMDKGGQHLRFEVLAAIVDRQKAEAFLKALSPNALHPEVDRLLDEDYERNYHATGQLRGLDAKVTLIAGVFDPIRVWEPGLRAVFPQAPLLLITGAAHLPWIDKPEETTAALGKALGR
jgi:proline iminopeptidase